MPLDSQDQDWLTAYIEQQGGLAGSVHRAAGDDLHLTAAMNLPPPVMAAVAVVPRGKGMAGLAQVRGRPVQTCNLQEDDSGQINPTARLVNGQAAIALPLKDEAGAVRAVVGIAFAHEGEIGPDQETALSRAADSLP